MYVTSDTSAIVPHAFTADAAYPANTRMKMSGTFGVLTAAGDEAHLGTLYRRTTGAGDEAVLVHKNASGAIAYVAGGAIVKGAQTTSAASGRVVTGTAGAIDFGYALNDAAQSGDTVLVLPL